MFNDPGSTIKVVSKILFFLNVVALLVLAIVFGSFWIALVGIVFSYVECLLFYGFGELVKNSGKTEDTKKAEEDARIEYAEEENEDSYVSNEEIERDLLEQLEKEGKEQKLS